ncbi:YtnP family quorum-quenching lactonase [Sediminibacillus massiliensis]|uniref:YtnP family quorum-quenching lactonase n=1 Tax=Sediminibacillus massiliensis TaxID=1926277 RepID=UPI000988836B|nr:MBL fold metallo-hydrolase [Sediminibacillus massiliensis]
METLNVGRAKLTWLNGGVNHLDGGAMFGVVPKPLWSKKYPSNLQNQIELRTDPILIELNNQRFLVDSGIGKDKLSAKQLRNFGVLEQSDLDGSLNKLGFTRNEIDGILMTHLHFDHACGLTRWNDGTLSSSFPDSIIYTNRTEWSEMRNPNIRSVNTYWEDNWKPVQSQVTTFEDEMEIVPGLRMIHTSGHSDGHSIIVFEDGEEMFIHMGDIMPTNAHQNPLWALAYDDYPVTSVHEKKKWMDLGYQKQAWFTFYHDAYFRAIKYDHDGKVIEEVKRNRHSYTQ